jgi:hypothetical protein
VHNSKSRELEKITDKRPEPKKAPQWAESRSEAAIETDIRTMTHYSRDYSSTQTV